MDEHGHTGASSADLSIFEPFDRLVEIRVTGRRLLVPERNTLLRGFQFVWPGIVPYGDFCWNGDCENCHAFLAGRDGGEERVLSCRTTSREGMEIVRLSPELHFLVGRRCRDES